METNPPWLLVSHGYNNSKQSFYSVSDKRFYTKHVPDLVNQRVFASAYGWLVTMDQDTTQCCFWNPVSMEKINLPLLFRPFSYNRCFVSKPPNEPECYVLFISRDFLRTAFCQIGDDYERFVVQSYKEEELRLLTAASFQGKIYGLAIPGFQIVTVHFVGKKTIQLRPILTEDHGGQQPMHIHQPSRPWSDGHADYLIASPCGELLLVHVMCHSNYDFRVYRVDTNRKECIELDNMDNRTIFLGAMGSNFCCFSTERIKSNCIYYTIPTSKNLYIYDLDDRSTTMLLPCRSARLTQTLTCWVEHQSFI